MNFDFKGMLEQAKKVKEEIEKTKDELKKHTVEGESGGGIVKVKFNGDHQMLKLEVDENIINAGDNQMVMDLIVAAVNNGLEKVKDLHNEEMKKVSSFLPNIPGFNL